MNNEDTIAAELQPIIHRLIGDEARKRNNVKMKHEFVQGALKALAREMAGLIVTFYRQEGWPKMVNQMLQEVTDIVRTRDEELKAKRSPILKA